MERVMGSAAISPCGAAFPTVWTVYAAYKARNADIAASRWKFHGELGERMVISVKNIMMDIFFKEMAPTVSCHGVP